ncbi:MAG: hypothetical protein AAF922_13835 [Pseudomonadota bacterium]
MNDRFEPEADVIPWSIVHGQQCTQALDTVSTLNCEIVFQVRADGALKGMTGMAQGIVTGLRRDGVQVAQERLGSIIRDARHVLVSRGTFAGVKRDLSQLGSEAV